MPLFRRKKAPQREKASKSGLFLVKNGVRREVSFEELTLSNTLSLEALVRVLTRRGSIEPKELLEEMDKVKTERFREGMPPADDEVTH
jgi:hypothetical protein